MNKIILTLLGLLFIPALHSFGTTEADTVKIPDSLLSRDALILSKDVKMTYRVYNKESVYLLEEQNIRKKIKVLTENGVKEYSEIKIPVNKFSKIKDLTIMIHKANGDSVSVKTDFYKIQNPGDNKFFDEKHLKTSVPGLQSGDIIDLQIRIDNRTALRYPFELFFNEDVPALNVNYTLRFININTQIKVYHNLPLPKPVISKNDTSYTWSFPYLKALPSESNSIWYNEIPYVRYMLLKLSKPIFGVSVYIDDSWKKVFEGFSMIENERPKQKKADYFDEFMTAKLQNCEGLSNFEKFQKIYQFIQDSMEVVELRKKTNYCSGYYLSTRKINSFRLIMLYIDLCRYFHYDYYFVLARNKFDGDIDEDFITEAMHDAVFLSFKDENGTLHYLITSYVRKPGIDQFNPVYQGTKAMLVNPKRAESYEMVTLPEWKAENSGASLEGTISTDPESNTATMNVIAHYLGVRSMYYSNRYDKSAGADSANQLLEKDLKQRFSNLKISKYYFGTPSLFFPYPYDLSYSGERTDLMTRIDQDIFSFPLGSWIDHTLIPTDETKRQTDYYPVFPYTSSFSYRITFPYPVELLNSQKLQADYQNEYGSVSMKIGQENDTTLTISSVYKIVTNHVPVKDYPLLKEINDKWDQYKDASLMIRKKKNL